MNLFSRYLVQSWRNSGIWEFARHTYPQSVSFKEVELYELLHAKRDWGLPWAVSVYLQLLLLAANACQHGPSLQARSLCVGSMGTHLAAGCSNLVGKQSGTQSRTGAVVKSCCSVRSEVSDQLLGLCGNLIYNINATLASVILSLISHQACAGLVATTPLITLSIFLTSNTSVSTSLLVNGRLAKLEYVEALDAQERRSECVAKELFVHLAPILNNQALVQAEKMVHAQVLKLWRDLNRNRPANPFCKTRRGTSTLLQLFIWSHSHIFKDNRRRT